MRILPFIGAAALVATVAARTANSQPDQSNPGGPTSLERVTACQACHGTDGIATFGPAPNLAGQKASYLQAQLHAFHDGTRKSDFMNPIAAQLTDGEIVALASHFESLPPSSASAADRRSASAVATSLRLPADFPKGFKEYSRADDDDAGTVTVSYANAFVLEAVRAGAKAPAGAMIVVATSAAQRGSDGRLLKDPKGTLIAGPSKSYNVSATGSGWGDLVPMTLRNGDWHYAQFDAGAKLLTKNQAACLACHRGTAATDFVFGVKDIRKVAGGA